MPGTGEEDVSADCTCVSQMRVRSTPQHGKGCIRRNGPNIEAEVIRQAKVF